MNEPESPIMAKILIRFNFETEIYVRYRSEEIAPSVYPGLIMSAATCSDFSDFSA